LQCVFDFKVEGGTSSAKHYGIDLARKVGFPQSVVDLAMKISNQLESSWLEIHENNAEYQKRRLSESVLAAALSLAQ
jgi:DNA mismatch repair ATPase MutS